MQVAANNEAGKLNMEVCCTRRKREEEAQKKRERVSKGQRDGKLGVSKNGS